MQVARKLAGIFSSGTVLVVGSIVLLRSMSLDFDAVFYACKLSIISGLVAGFLGYSIGKAFEKTGRGKRKTSHKRSSRDAGLLIDDILDNDLDSLDAEKQTVEK